MKQSNMWMIALGFALVFTTSLYIKNRPQKATSPFEKILLIINYNFPHYQSIPFIKKLYEPYFPNIVFYGEQPHQDVYSFYQQYGALSYLALADAMKQHPHYDGYLFCHDDCIIHPWQFKNFDQQKIWFAKLQWLDAETGNPGDIRKGLEAFPHWFWWSSEYGAVAMEKAYAVTPDTYKTMLADNWGTANVVVAYSDIVYIPKAYCKDFIKLAQLYYDHKCFLETALPTIVSCLAPKNTWEYLQGHAPDIKNTIGNYKSEVAFNHPIKLSSLANQNFIERQFGRVSNT